MDDIVKDRSGVRAMALGKNGEVIDDLLTVACGKNSIRILEIQRQGKKVQNTSTFLLGSKIKKGVSLKRE